MRARFIALDFGVIPSREAICKRLIDLVNAMRARS
jgi:hypothetical protein